MRSRLILAAAGVMACSLTTNLAAQGGIAIIPFIGYGLGGTLAEDNPNDIHLMAKSSMLLGAQIELGLSKNLGIAAGVNRTFSQKLDIEAGGAVQGSDDFTMMQFTGALVVRPGGRRPNGAVTPLFIEVGGGVTMYTIGSAAFPNSDFDATSSMFFAGAGYNVPVGPRATVQIFGRAQMITAYESTGLDDFNTAPPPTQVEGGSMLNIQIGVGFRFGR